MGHHGNELADNPAKEATKNKETVYKKNITSSVYDCTVEDVEHSNA